MRQLTKSLLTLLFLSIGVALFGQQDSIRVKALIKNIETEFQVSFSYSDSDISELWVPTIDLAGIDAWLKHIERHTDLRFQKIDERFIAVIRAAIIENVCGKILDAQTRGPIEEGIIFFNGALVFTDHLGNFTLDDFSANDSLTIQMIGYHPKTIHAKTFEDGECAEILLTPRPYNLEEVVITDYLTQGINVERRGIFSISTPEFGTLPGLTDPDVLHTMQFLPGIHSYNETVSYINIRGGTNDQNLILWNGIRMYQNGHFFGLISAFSPYHTNRLTVIKNGTSAEFGHAVSGTVKMQSNNDIAEDFSGTAGNNLVNGDLYLEIPLTETSSINVSARHSISDLWRTPTFDRYFERAFRDTEIFESETKLVTSQNQFRFYDAGVDLNKKLRGSDRLQVNLLALMNKLTYTEEADIGSSTNRKTSGLQQSNVAAGISYHRKWNNQHFSDIRVALSNYHLSATNFDITNDQRFVQQNLVLDMGALIKSNLVLNSRSDLIVGYELAEMGITNSSELNRPDFRSIEKDVVTTHAVFAEGTRDFRKGSTLTLGLRGNYLENLDKFILEPRVAATKFLTDKIYLELLGEFKHQVTSQIVDFQTDFLGVEKRRWVLSNDEDIPIIRSNQISLGANYKDDSFLMTFEAYRKHVNSIITSSQGFQNQFQFVRSSGDYTVYGLDAMINKKFERLSTWLGYGIARNTYAFADLEPVSFPNNVDITHSISAGTNITFEKWVISSGLNFRTGRPFTQPIEGQEIADGQINYDLPNSSNIDDYLRVDISVKYRFLNRIKTKGLVALSVWNIFNRNNQTNIYYQLEPSEDIRRIEQEALGQTVNLSVRVNF